MIVSETKFTVVKIANNVIQCGLHTLGLSAALIYILVFFFNTSLLKFVLTVIAIGADYNNRVNIFFSGAGRISFLEVHL